MEDGILDSQLITAKPKYASVWKNGLLFGIAVTIFVLSIKQFIFRTNLPENFGEDIINNFLIWLIIIVVFLAYGAAMFRVAAWGDRRFHYFRILLTGLISYQTTLLLTVIYSYTIHLIKASTRSFFSGEDTLIWASLNIPIFIMALILWLIPGKLPYFNKQKAL